jgi:hypothetical protein
MSLLKVLSADSARTAVAPASFAMTSGEHKATQSENVWRKQSENSDAIPRTPTRNHLILPGLCFGGTRVLNLLFAPNCH